MNKNFALQPLPSNLLLGTLFPLLSTSQLPFKDSLISANDHFQVLKGLQFKQNSRLTSKLSLSPPSPKPSPLSQLIMGLCMGRGTCTPSHWAPSWLQICGRGRRSGERRQTFPGNVMLLHLGSWSLSGADSQLLAFSYKHICWFLETVQEPSKYNVPCQSDQYNNIFFKLTVWNVGDAVNTLGKEHGWLLSTGK